MKRVLPFMAAMLATLFVCGQAVPIALDDFESTPSSPGFGFSFTGSGDYQSGSSSSGERPANSPFYSSGSRSYSVNSGSATLTSSVINSSAHNYVTLLLKVAAFSLNSTNGLEATDFVRVEVSPDGGTTFYNTAEVTGFSNAYWSYSGGTGDAVVSYDGDNSPQTFAPVGGGNRTTDGYSDIIITNLPSVSNLVIRIQLRNNNAQELWVIDDARLMGSEFPFAVSFSGIKAFAKTNGNQLEWSNLSESGLIRYDIERSADGRAFVPVASLDPEGNMGGKQDYTWFDGAPYDGLNFYRIKAVEFSGRSMTSAIIKVSAAASAASLQVYPNPVRGHQFTIQTNGLKEGLYTLKIFDAWGREVMHRFIKQTATAMTQTIELPEQAAKGMYSLQYVNADTKLIKNFLIQ